MNKIINLQNYQKPKKNYKMFFLTIFIGAFAGFALWHYFVENIAALDVSIPPSKNISFSETIPLAMTTSQVADEFEKADGKPVLLYIYTTWCGVCKKNIPVVNEIAREFQSTDLQVITLAIDRGIDEKTLQNYLNGYGDIYFYPRFLSFKEGFIDLLKKKEINYKNRIPFTVLIGRNGEIITKFSGIKSKNYIRNKIVRQFN
jgi:thiol-disulfide isomerase/thioredoxin